MGVRCFTCLQVLQATLRQRDADRNQRLTTAASTTSALHKQSQHVRGIAAASAAAAAAADQEHCTTESTLHNGQYLGQQRGADTLQGWDSPRDGSCSGRGSSNGGHSGSGAGVAGCVSGEAALRLLLPSSGAGAAAAIAARGAVHSSRLPSKAAKTEVRGIYAVSWMRNQPLEAQIVDWACVQSAPALVQNHTRVGATAWLSSCWLLELLNMVTVADVSCPVCCCAGRCSHTAAD